MSSTLIKAHGEAPLDVVIAGGGVAGLEAMIALHRLAGPRVPVELLAPERKFVYRPLSVAEPFGLAEPARIELLPAGTARDIDATRWQASIPAVAGCTPSAAASCATTRGCSRSERNRSRR